MASYLATETPSDFINNLPDIETADLVIRAHSERIKSFVKQVEELAKEKGVLDCCGVFVLHRHHQHEDGKIMVRSYDANSMKVSVSCKTDKSVPASWMLLADEDDDAVFVPTEWAEDEGASQQLKRLQDSGFFEGFADLATSAGMNNILGVTLSWANSLDIKEDQILVEKTDLDDSEVFVANVVEPEVASSFSIEELIPTNWFFTAAAGCSCQRLPAECVSWNTYCVPRAPGHSIVRRCTRRRLRHKRTCIG